MDIKDRDKKLQVMKKALEDQKEFNITLQTELRGVKNEKRKEEDRKKGREKRRRGETRRHNKRGAKKSNKPKIKSASRRITEIKIIKQEKATHKKKNAQKQGTPKKDEHQKYGGSVFCFWVCVA